MITYGILLMIALFFNYCLHHLNPDWEEPIQKPVDKDT